MISPGRGASVTSLLALLVVGACTEATLDRCNIDTDCAPGERCRQGACVPAGADEGEACADGCGDGLTCVRGVCFLADCADVTCGEGAVCGIDGCVAIDCADVSCATGTACAGGSCLPTRCGDDELCAAGLVCADGACLDKRCEGVSCADGLECRAAACRSCASAETACGDGFDDDCDGFTDCADSDCRGDACEDGDPCTIGEVCGTDASCTGGEPDPCTTPPPCHELPGTCDRDAGGCVYPLAAPESACDDGDACTLDTTCDASGACAGGSTVACVEPPGSCFAPEGVCDRASGSCVHTPLGAGTVCSDACATGTCDDAGACVSDGSSATVDCSVPPDQCLESGTCDAVTGTCAFEPKPAGADCDDDDGCTAGDACDGSGACVPGPVCPDAPSCKVAVCNGDACELSDAPDGDPCGPNPADICCGGACVDITSDAANCGGCGLQCAADQDCVDVADTDCAERPAGTSGRCTCAGATSDCPLSDASDPPQVCRTQSPNANFCTPKSDAGCNGGSFVEVNFCPNYCAP